MPLWISSRYDLYLPLKKHEKERDEMMESETRVRDIMERMIMSSFFLPMFGY